MTLIIVLSILILLFFTITYICYRITFGYSKKLDITPHTLPEGKQYEPLHSRMKQSIKSALALPYEEVFIKSFDGLRLFGRYYEVKPGAPLKILFHGYRSNAIRDFSEGLQYDMESGFNVLLVDQRAHGKSEGKAITFGVLERYDCLAWVNYAAKRFGNEVPIILNGLSMGASTVLMASDLELPRNVVGIIADCGFSSPKDIICKVIKDQRLPSSVFYFFVRIGGKIFGGFDIEESTAVMSVKNTTVPILFVHGEDDRFVPCEMSRQAYNECGSKKWLLTVKGAGHGLSYLIDTKAYQKALLELWKEAGVVKE